jgi:uncharacterized protein involved in exopolysaccharide biosynthesis
MPGSVGMPRNRGRINADTTSEPEGITRRVVLNVLEAFFRRPWLHLLPLILLIALGAATAFSSTEEFRAVGTITAESTTAIGDATETNNNGFNFETPASVTARDINEKLRTNEFLTAVADKLQADAPASQNALLRRTIARSVQAFDDGQHLVRVAATTEGSELSFRLAQATIDTYIETVINNSARQNDETVAFFEGQVASAQAAYTAAQTALNDFLVQNNISLGSDEIAVPQQIVIAQLQADADRTESQYGAQLTSLDDAKQRAAATRTEIAQRIRVTDAPTSPGAPEPRLKSAVLTVIIFGVLGVLLSLASVIVAATLDRTIRVPGDITAKFGLDVLAVVPDARAR